MGLRFRKSINLGGARINISKSGVGGSIGTKGARITKTANGRTRKTVGIPGTGISYVTESSSKKKGTQNNAKAKGGNTEQQPQLAQSNAGVWKVALTMVRIALYLWGVLMLILFFPVGLLLLGLAIFWSIMNRRKKKKSKMEMPSEVFNAEETSN